MLSFRRLAMRIFIAGFCLPLLLPCQIRAEEPGLHPLVTALNTLAEFFPWHLNTELLILIHSMDLRPLPPMVCQYETHGSYEEIYVPVARVAKVEFVEDDLKKLTCECQFDIICSYSGRIVSDLQGCSNPFYVDIAPDILSEKTLGPKFDCQFTQSSHTPIDLSGEVLIPRGNDEKQACSDACVSEALRIKGDIEKDPKSLKSWSDEYCAVPAPFQLQFNRAYCPIPRPTPLPQSSSISSE